MNFCSNDLLYNSFQNERMNFCSENWLIFKSTVAIKGNFDIRINAMHIKDSREFFSVISRLHIDEQMNFCSKCTLNLLGKFFSEISLLHIVERMNFCSKCTLKLSSEIFQLHIEERMNFCSKCTLIAYALSPKLEKISLMNYVLN